MPKLGHKVTVTEKIQLFSKESLLSDSDYVKKRRDLLVFQHQNHVCSLSYKAIFGIADPSNTQLTTRWVVLTW